MRTTDRRTRDRRPRFRLGAVPAFFLFAAFGCGRVGVHRDASPPRAAFVDEAACAKCHEKEWRAWLGSHHQLAMQPANEKTVLADFADSDFRYAGVATHFFRRNGKYFVSTDGPEGKPAEFEVAFTFGVYPLQQFLIPLPGGRLQALSIAWDVEKRRWFHLYPAEKIDSRDPLHWTKPAQNWNFMCAECHSTDVHKNWDGAGRQYRTTYSQVNVGCQACHGPGSRHVEDLTPRPPFPVKRGRQARMENGGRYGLEVELGGPQGKAQIEICARCHSRRAAIWSDYRYGGRLMDTHLPALLAEGTYHADGQILEEDYEYGSFVQSRMFARGVRCADCHDPHSGKTRRRGDDLCLACHAETAHPVRPWIDFSGLKAKRYDSPAHHFHAIGKPGSHCIDCHMAVRNYMVVHARHDHGFRIPRPDLTVAIGTPNACNDCHKDKSPTWAADAVGRWYGPNRRREPHFGEAIAAGRARRPGAAAALAAIVDDATQPAIARATALDLLKEYPGAVAGSAFLLGITDVDPMVRRAALEGLEGFPPKERVRPAAPLLSDPVRAVRIEAARLLAPLGRQDLGGSEAAFEAALAEFLAAQESNADQPSSMVNLGNFRASRGETAAAEAAYRNALALDPAFVPASVNLADLVRSAGREKDAEATLRSGLRHALDQPALHHALGLTLARERNMTAALAELALAAKESPDDARYAYVYGVALHDSGKPRAGIAILERALARHPGDRDLLLGLAGYAREAGDPGKAAACVARLRAIDPSDPALAPRPKEPERRQ